MTERMTELAKSLGRVDEAEETAIACLCEAAEQELLGRLKDSVSREDCGSAFDAAGAWIALAGLCEARAAGETVTAFSAGELTLKTKNGAEDSGADALRRQAERLMKPFLEEDGFCFLGVPQE